MSHCRLPSCLRDEYWLKITLRGGFSGWDAESRKLQEAQAGGRAMHGVIGCLFSQRHPHEGPIVRKHGNLLPASWERM